MRSDRNVPHGPTFLFPTWSATRVWLFDPSVFFLRCISEYVGSSLPVIAGVLLFYKLSTHILDLNVYSKNWYIIMKMCLPFRKITQHYLDCLLGVQCVYHMTGVKQCQHQLLRTWVDSDSLTCLHQADWRQILTEPKPFFVSAPWEEIHWLCRPVYWCIHWIPPQRCWKPWSHNIDTVNNLTAGYFCDYGCRGRLHLTKRWK